jgi:MoxR-like ATPase
VPYDLELARSLRDRVVGRSRELEAVVAALATRRHLLLEGPPGTGKSTMLRAVAELSDTPFEFVEGNAELTPARLVGTFDPAAVLESGYSPDVFIDGPLVAALRDGSLLYVEEINRVPEETLNVLISVMSEGELHVPRLGRIVAADGFRLVAAMNPFDAVGTARISSAVYDRCCRLSMGYQTSAEEALIVGHDAPKAAGSLGPGAILTIVELVRATRDHPDIRAGSSVRGAIDLALLVAELASLRSVEPLDPRVTHDAAQLALSGRIRVRDGSGRSPEDIVEELWRRFFAIDDGDDGSADPKA